MEYLTWVLLVRGGARNHHSTRSRSPQQAQSLPMRSISSCPAPSPSSSSRVLQRYFLLQIYSALRLDLYWMRFTSLHSQPRKPFHFPISLQNLHQGFLLLLQGLAHFWKKHLIWKKGMSFINLVWFGKIWRFPFFTFVAMGWKCLELQLWKVELHGDNLTFNWRACRYISKLTFGTNLLAIV